MPSLREQSRGGPVGPPLAVLVCWRSSCHRCLAPAGSTAQAPPTPLLTGTEPGLHRAPSTTPIRASIGEAVPKTGIVRRSGHHVRGAAIPTRADTTADRRARTARDQALRRRSACARRPCSRPGHRGDELRQATAIQVDASSADHRVTTFYAIGSADPKPTGATSPAARNGAPVDRDWCRCSPGSQLAGRSQLRRRRSSPRSARIRRRAPPRPMEGGEHRLTAGVPPHLRTVPGGTAPTTTRRS